MIHTILRANRTFQDLNLFKGLPKMNSSYECSTKWISSLPLNDRSHQWLREGKSEKRQQQCTYPVCTFFFCCLILLQRQKKNLFAYFTSILPSDFQEQQPLHFLPWSVYWMFECVNQYLVPRISRATSDFSVSKEKKKARMVAVTHFCACGSLWQRKKERKKCQGTECYFQQQEREPEPFPSLRTADGMKMSNVFVTIVDGKLQLSLLVSQQSK